jgi:hypothetical protein
MARRSHHYLDRVLRRRSLRRWSLAARNAETAELNDLRLDLDEARSLRQHLDKIIFVAESRLAEPRIGSTTFERPDGTDWSWRPDLWRGPLAQKGKASIENRTPLGDDVTLFHDSTICELTARQLRNQGISDLSPFSLKLDTFRFPGSFLSLVIDMPEESCQGLKRRHIFRLSVTLELEHPIEVFARLNIRHGPNTEQIVRELPKGEAERFVEFDLAYSKLNEKRVEAMWVDLIFDKPVMNEIVVRDLTFSRYPRAEL